MFLSALPAVLDEDCGLVIAEDLDDDVVGTAVGARLGGIFGGWRAELGSSEDVKVGVGLWVVRFKLW